MPRIQQARAGTRATRDAHRIEQTRSRPLDREHEVEPLRQTHGDPGGEHAARAVHGAIAEALLALGAAAVLVKGGHVTGPRVGDVLVARDGTRARFESERLGDGPVHGTGCMLASGIATGLAQGLGLVVAIERARSRLLDAMRVARRDGAGARQLDPWHALRKP